MLTEVKLIINNAPLTYQNTIKPYLPPIICYLTGSYHVILTQRQL